MSNARALDIALNKIGNLKLKDCSSMQEYLNKHELIRLDIINSKGTFDDAQLVSKILRGLTPRYNNFVDQYHLLNNDVNEDVKEMTTKLLTYESKLVERDAEKKASKSDNISPTADQATCQLDVGHGSQGRRTRFLEAEEHERKAGDKGSRHLGWIEEYLLT